MKSRLLIILVFVVMAGMIGVAGAIRVQHGDGLTLDPAIKPVAVRCELLEQRVYTVTETFYGLIEANARIDMAFQIAGRIAQIGHHKDEPVVENQRVREGDVIATLEPLRYEAAVEQAKASMDEAKAAMASAQAVIDQARVRYEDAIREVDRYRRLKNRNAANEREIEKAEVEQKLAKAQLDSAQAQMASAHASYQAARAASTMAGVNLQDTILRAPMDATVAAVPVEIGQMASPSQTVVTLVDLTKVKLTLGVVERKLPLLRQGQTVSVEVRALMSQSKLLSDSKALSRPRRGRVTIVPPAADPITGLFDVEIELDNQDGLLRPGMVGKATVKVMEKKAIAIPATAAIRSGDRAWAFFMDERGYRTGLDLGDVGQVQVQVPTPVARRIWFEPVSFDKDYYLLSEAPQGLTLLIVEGQSRLTDGQTVRPVDALASVPPVAPSP